MIHALRTVRPLTLTLMLVLLLSCGKEKSDQPARVSDTTIQQVQEETAHKDNHEGEAEARVTLSDTAMQTAGIKIESVTTGASAGSRTLVVPGQVQFDPRRVALISPRVAGRLEQLMVVEGDRVRAGQVVAALYSPAFVTAQSDLVQANRRAKLLTGTSDSAGAAALADAAARRLRVLGVGDSAMARLTSEEEPSDFLSLSSPLNGTITESHTLPGAAIEAGAPVFKVSDQSVMDVVAEVPEQSLPMVEIGQKAAVSIAAYPGVSFEGEVERMSGELNSETRTVQAVVHVPNRGSHLRAGMFATVRLAIRDQKTDSAAPAVLSIPASAIVTESNQSFVFVEVGRNTFERREVEVGSLTPPGSMSPIEGRMAVRAGLAAGDRIVVEGAFTLKSELAKASLGEHGH